MLIGCNDIAHLLTVWAEVIVLGMQFLAFDGGYAVFAFGIATAFLHGDLQEAHGQHLAAGLGNEYWLFVSIVDIDALLNVVVSVAADDDVNAVDGRNKVVVEHALAFAIGLGVGKVAQVTQHDDEVAAFAAQEIGFAIDCCAWILERDAFPVAVGD